MNVVVRKINLSQESLVGKKRDTRKKPHVIYVALEVYSLPKQQYFILTGI
jgi:hypothetical protein